MALNQLVLFIVTYTIVCCEGYFKEQKFHKAPEFADKMCAHDQVDFQTVTKSAMSCVQKCSEKPECRNLVYLPSNQTCFGINTDYPFGVNTSLPGAIFYQSDNPQTTTTSTSSTTTTTTPTTTTMASTTTPPPPPQATTTSTSSITTQTITTTSTTKSTTATSTPQQTTSGSASPLFTNIGDSQFDASSEKSTNYGPASSRLSNTANCWAPSSQDQNQWIQVDFIYLVVAMGVITSGDPQFKNWVVSYRILTSVDCSSFLTIEDNGGDIIFTGNTDQNTEVTTHISPPLICRCFRINPYDWQGPFIALRFEVIGYKA